MLYRKEICYVKNEHKMHVHICMYLNKKKKKKTRLNNFFFIEKIFGGRIL